MSGYIKCVVVIELNYYSALKKEYFRNVVLMPYHG